MAPRTRADTTTTLSMKLLIDTKAKRVLFAEADKDVVGFFFSFLALPVATIVGMLGKESMCGSFGNLYASVENLLHPTIVPSAASTGTSSLLLPAPSSEHQPKSFFKCSHYYRGRCYEYVTDRSSESCPNCGQKMIRYVPPPAWEVQMMASSSMGSATAKGFLHGVVTYTVRDNLVVTSISTNSSISLLNTLAVTDFATLQEKTVQLGHTKGLKILEASLQSNNTVLTDVYLSKEASPPWCLKLKQLGCAYVAKLMP